MAKFKGFNNQQLHQLLSEHGYTGPAQKDDMDLFLASSPSASSKIGRYAEIAKQREPFWAPCKAPKGNI